MNKLLYPTRLGYIIRRLYLYSERRFFKHNKVLTGPVQIKLNTGYKCNLSCPLFPTGRRVHPRIGDLTADKARYFLSRMNAFYRVSLFGWGEPFLNNDIFDIIALLKRSNKYVATDSNLNIKNKKIIDRIAQSHIDFISVSLDGIDQDSYIQYRYGGFFEVVVRNIAYLRDVKSPKIIEWQYLVSKKNMHLVEKATKMAEQIGVPIRFQNIGLYVDIFYENGQEIKEEWWTRDQRINEENSNRRASKGICHYMYNEPFIDCDGRVYPCCNSVFAPRLFIENGFNNVFGDLNKNTLDEIWNNEYYQSARSLFSRRLYSGRKVKPICMKCRVYMMTLHNGTVDMPLFNGKYASTAVETH